MKSKLITIFAVILGLIVILILNGSFLETGINF
jgi:hypothetical protein